MIMEEEEMMEQEENDEYRGKQYEEKQQKDDAVGVGEWRYSDEKKLGRGISQGRKDVLREDKKNLELIVWEHERVI